MYVPSFSARVIIFGSFVLVGSLLGLISFFAFPTVNLTAGMEGIVFSDANVPFYSPTYYGTLKKIDSVDYFLECQGTCDIKICGAELFLQNGTIDSSKSGCGPYFAVRFEEPNNFPAYPSLNYTLQINYRGLTSANAIAFWTVFTFSMILFITGSIFFIWVVCSSNKSNFSQVNQEKKVNSVA